MQQTLVVAYLIAALPFLACLQNLNCWKGRGRCAMNGYAFKGKASPLPKPNVSVSK